MNQNDDFRYLYVELPPDIARRKVAGDLEGALRLIEARLAGDCEPELAARLRCEKIRLARLEGDYPYDRAAALALIRKEWPGCTEGQFDALVEGGRIDWRYIHGQLRYHEEFSASARLYPKEAPGLKPEERDEAWRQEMLERMEAEGELSAEITIRAAVKARAYAAGKLVKAWLPVPADCSQQSGIEILAATPGYALAPADAPARTIYWESRERDSFEVVYRYRHRAVYVDPFTIRCDPVQPTFCTEEELPHIAFTPSLRALSARLTAGCSTPVEKAAAIYRYVTDHVDYRFQPEYMQLDCIPAYCAGGLRGDCGVMALLFITLCRIAGVPAQWQSGLSARPDGVGSHDWAMFYAAPYGWLYADASFGSSARRQGDRQRQRHYFGNLDPCRMVANSAFQAPLTPPDEAVRIDPYDNQRGEMSVDGAGLSAKELEQSQELLEFRFL